MPDMVETYAGPTAWWEGISPTLVARTLLDKNLTPQEMLDEAMIRWTVSKSPLSYRFGKQNIVLPDMVATTRDTDGAYLGTVRPSYQVVQNEVLAEIAEALISEGATAHTGGSLFGGRIVWLLFQTNPEMYVDGDPRLYKDYLLAVTGHDGKHAVQFLNTPTCVVCWNTMHLAIGNARAMVSLKHTANVGGRLDQVRKALGFSESYTAAYKMLSAKLATKPMTPAGFEDFVKVLIPDPEGSEHAWRTERDRAEIAALFDHSSTLEGVGFTAYRALQAVGEWADHFDVIRTTKTGNAADRRALSILEGPAYDLKTAAAKLLVKA